MATSLSLTGDVEQQTAAAEDVHVGEFASAGTERIEMVGVRIGQPDPEQEEAAADRNKGAAEVLMRGQEDVAEIFRPPGG